MSYKKKETDELPDKILIIPNPEKKFHEKWEKGRNMLNIPHPFKMLLCSIQANLGKTNIIKNILLRIKPKFKDIFLLHCGGDLQTEYDDIDYKLLEELPDVNDESVFDPKRKTLLIIEDKNFKFMPKEQLHILDRIFGFVSSHRNLSVIVASQSFMDVPISVRRMSNFFILWKNKDIDMMKTLGRRCGLMKNEMMYLMKKYLVDPHDSLWVDCTKGSPYELRINGYTLINKKENNIT